MEKKRNRISEREFDQIILAHTFGKSIQAISTDTGLSRATVERVVKAYKIVKGNDTQAELEYVKAGYRLYYLELAAMKIGAEIPEEVRFAYDVKLSEAAANQRERKAKKTAEPAEERPELPADVYVVSEPYKEVQTQNENLYLCKVLEALAKTNELLETLMDVVIPKYVNDLKDNINVNADIVSEQLKNSDAKLEKVVINTRKRGT